VGTPRAAWIRWDATDVTAYEGEMKGGSAKALCLLN